MRFDLTMEGPPFTTAYSQPADFLQSDSGADGVDTFSASTSTLSSDYTSGGAFDPRRRDGIASSSFPTIAPSQQPNVGRYGPENGLAPDGSHRAANDLAPSSPPVPPGQLPAHYGYHTVHTVPAHPGTTLPTLVPPELHPIPTYQPVYRDTAAIHNATADHFHPSNQVLPRPGISSPVYLGDRSSFPPQTFVDRSYYPVPTYPIYEVPRTTVPSSSGYPPHTYNMNSPTQSQRSDDRVFMDAHGQTHDQTWDDKAPDYTKFPWANYSSMAELFCNGHLIEADIQVRVEGGFFQCREHGRWTTYRRNYHKINCSYTLPPNVAGQRLYVRKNGTQEMVKALAVRISSAVEGQNGKTVDMIRHTPKRDQGPKFKVTPIRVLPKPPSTGTHPAATPSRYGNLPFHQTGAGPAPILPHQHKWDGDPEPEPNSKMDKYVVPPPPANPGQETSHTFERIQFKNATANNGKRRASQQYFHVNAELLADVSQNENDPPMWHMIAKRTSCTIVVRGRSPSHYQNEGVSGSGPSSRRIAQPGGRFGRAATGVSPRPMRFGDMVQPHLRSPVSGSGTATGPTMGYPSVGYGSTVGFRPQYPAHNSSGGSASASPDSVSADGFDAGHHPAAGQHTAPGRHPASGYHPATGMLSQSDRSAINEIHGYSYHPGPMYESVGHLQLPRPGGLPRNSIDPRSPSFRYEFPEATPGPRYHVNGGFGRYEGLRTSEDVFPDHDGGGGSYS